MCEKCTGTKQLKRMNRLNKRYSSLLLSAILLVSVGWVGCQSEADKMESKADREFNEVKEDLEADWVANRDELAEDLREMRQKVDEELQSLEEELDSIEEDAEERAELEEERSMFKKQLDRIDEAASDVGNATKETWDDVKDGVENTAEDVGDWFEKQADNIDEMTKADTDNDGQ